MQPPDSVEIACDTLARMMGQTPEIGIEAIKLLGGNLPPDRSAYGTKRLIEEHLVHWFEKGARPTPYLYQGFVEAVVAAAFAAALPCITPRPQLALPLYSKHPSFTLIEQLGYGGMASVWRCRRSVSGEDLAVKLPWTTAAQIPWNIRVDALNREALWLRRLSHPHVVRLLDVVADAGNVSYPMLELLPGRIPSGPVEPFEAIRWARDIAGACEYFRQQGLVHRDLKSANIALDSAGSVKVFDLGLAMDLSERGAYEGERAGTPGRMTPEQLFGLGTRTDGRADVVAIGLMMFEWLSGTAIPRLAPEDLTVAWMSEGFGLDFKDARAPAFLHPVFSRCVAYHPENRYPSAGALMTELNEMISTLNWWRVGQSCGASEVYASRVQGLVSAMRDVSSAEMTANTLAMRVLDAVGVIEEYERIGRLFPEVASSISTSTELWDPRRFLRTKQDPSRHSELRDGLLQVLEAYRGRMYAIVEEAGKQPAPRGDIVELARLVHSVPIATTFPERVPVLTLAVGFPATLAENLHRNWVKAPTSDAVTQAIEAYNGYAEQYLE
jgi:serine/threonine protein kinase